MRKTILRISLEIREMTITDNSKEEGFFILLFSLMFQIDILMVTGIFKYIVLLWSSLAKWNWAFCGYNWDQEQKQKNNVYKTQ